MNATITLATCLRLQAELANTGNRMNFFRASTGDKHLGLAPNAGHPCRRCPQGERAKKGEEMDEDVDELKKIERAVRKEMKNDRNDLNARVRESKKRMAEANRPGIHPFDETCACIQCGITRRKIRDEQLKTAPDPIEITARSIFIEISGQRIELCNSCALRYLKLEGI